MSRVLRDLGQFPMPITCPHCLNMIDWDASQTEDVLCPTCGTLFHLRDSEMRTTAAEMRPLGKFQLLERVGIGAFGAVWKARDPELDRLVAVKLMHRSQVTAATDRERFLREARAAAQLRHSGIVQVHEVAELEGVPAIVSDYVEGLTLRELLRLRRLSFRESAELIAQVADALGYAHSLGVVHRDIKPANVMIEFPPGHAWPASFDAGQPIGRGSRGSSTASGGTTGDGSTSDATTDGGPSRPGPRALLLDFGLALRDDIEVTMTVDGQIVGTPAYMSPEQAAGEAHRVDGRSDVYSLGIVLYELLSGELPFRGNVRMLVHQVLNEEPRPPRKLNHHIPWDLEAICLKAMAKEPGHRYGTAEELAADLRRYLQGVPVEARPLGALSRAWRWCRRVQRVRDAGILMIFAAVVLTLWATIGLVTFACGYFEPGVNRRAAVVQLVGVIVGFYMPLFWIGVATLARKLWAIWVGLAALLFDWSFSLACMLGFPFDLGGTYAHPVARVPTFSLLIALTTIGVLAYLAAVVGYYSNPNAMRWSRTPLGISRSH